LLLAGLIKAADNQAEVFKPQFQRKLMKNEIEYNRRRLQLEDSKDRQGTAEEVYTKLMCSNPQTYTSPLTNSTHVIVLSSGRVGSKMLTAVLFRHFEELGLSGVRLVHQHGFCYQFEQFSNIMVIYLYGFPEDVILGWRKNPYNWVKHGFSYFHNPQLVNFSLWPQVFEVDALGLEAQFDDCLRPHSFPFLSLRYETETEIGNTRTLQAFLGTAASRNKLQWPSSNEVLWGSNKLAEAPRKVRILELEAEDQRKLKRTYKRLHDKILRTPGSCIWPVVVPSSKLSKSTV